MAGLLDFFCNDTIINGLSQNCEKVIITGHVLLCKCNLVYMICSISYRINTLYKRLIGNCITFYKFTLFNHNIAVGIITNLVKRIRRRSGHLNNLKVNPGFITCIMIFLIAILITPFFICNYCIYSLASICYKRFKIIGLARRRMTDLSINVIIVCRFNLDPFRCK